MRKLRLPMVAAAFAVFLSISANATPVTWSFYETAIISCNGSPTDCVLPPQPFVLMTLTLPDPTSAGTAVWQGGASQPVYTGDSFALTIPVQLGVLHLTPAFSGDPSNPGGLDCTQTLNPSTICEFNISWSEAAGDLTSVSINVDATRDNVGGLAGPPSFGLTGGAIASDHTLGGCTNTQCVVGGFWQNDLPEPSSLPMLVTSFLVLLALRKRRRTSPSSCRRNRIYPSSP
ncbi:MAG TPA: PEP-CTERM sorting domain-containing protein [Stellaceae bacterium]|jgi:hypothetical protein